MHPAVLFIGSIPIPGEEWRTTHVISLDKVKQRTIYPKSIAGTESLYVSKIEAAPGMEVGFQCGFLNGSTHVQDKPLAFVVPDQKCVVIVYDWGSLPQLMITRPGKRMTFVIRSDKDRVCVSGDRQELGDWQPENSPAESVMIKPGFHITPVPIIPNKQADSAEYKAFHYPVEGSSDDAAWEPPSSTKTFIVRNRALDFVVYSEWGKSDIHITDVPISKMVPKWNAYEDFFWYKLLHRPGTPEKPEDENSKPDAETIRKQYGAFSVMLVPLDAMSVHLLKHHGTVCRMKKRARASLHSMKRPGSSSGELRSRRANTKTAPNSEASEPDTEAFEYIVTERTYSAVSGESNAEIQESNTEEIVHNVNEHNKTESQELDAEANEQIAEHEMSDAEREETVAMMKALLKVRGHIRAANDHSRDSTKTTELNDQSAEAINSNSEGTAKELDQHDVKESSITPQESNDKTQKPSEDSGISTTAKERHVAAKKSNAPQVDLAGLKPGNMAAIEPTDKTQNSKKESGETYTDAKEPNDKTQNPKKESGETDFDAKEPNDKTQNTKKESGENDTYAKEPNHKTQNPKKESGETYNDAKEPNDKTQNPKKEAIETDIDAKEPNDKAQNPKKESGDSSIAAKELNPTGKEPNDKIQKGDAPSAESKVQAKESSVPPAELDIKTRPAEITMPTVNVKTQESNQDSGEPFIEIKAPISTVEELSDKQQKFPSDESGGPDAETTKVDVTPQDPDHVQTQTLNAGVVLELKPEAGEPNEETQNHTAEAEILDIKEVKLEDADADIQVEKSAAKHQQRFKLRRSFCGLGKEKK